VSKRVINFRTLLRADKTTELVPLVTIVDRTDIYCIYCTQSISTTTVTENQVPHPSIPSQAVRDQVTINPDWDHCLSDPQPGSTDQALEARA